MNMKTKSITRFAAFALAATILTIFVAFGRISFGTKAIEASGVTVHNSISAETEQINNTNDDMPFTHDQLVAPPDISDQIIVQLGGADGGDGGGTTGGKSSDDAFQTVVNFFVKWLRRIGMLVGLIGAIMFALALKNNDAENKQAGLLTMVAGFVVAAICQAVDMFDIFT